MSWVIVILLVGLGLLLLLAEILFVPGTTFVGIVGLLLSVWGVYLSYRYFGASTGNYFFAGTGLAFLVATVLALRSKPWERLALKHTLTGRVSSPNDHSVDLKIGQTGRCISALRPIGKVEFDGKVFEAATLGNFADAGQAVTIISIEGNRIKVEPTTQTNQT